MQVMFACQMCSLINICRHSQEISPEKVTKILFFSREFCNGSAQVGARSGLMPIFKLKCASVWVMSISTVPSHIHDSSDIVPYFFNSRRSSELR